MREWRASGPGDRTGDGTRGSCARAAGPAERRPGQGARRGAARADDARGEGRPAHAGRRHLLRRRPRARGGAAQGRRRLRALGQRHQALQRAAEARRRGVAAQDPAALRARRDPRLPHDLPDPARHGGVLGPGGARARRRRSRRRRRAPPASTGPSRRWWTSRATRAGGGSSRARARTRTSASAMAAAQVRGFQGAVPRARPTGCSRARSTSPPTAPPTAGATTTPSTCPRGSCATSTSRRSQAAAKAGVGSFMSAYMDLNDVPATRQPVPAARRAARGVGLLRLRRERRDRGRATSSPRASRETARTPPRARSPPGWTWTWRAASSRRTWSRS